MIIEKTTIVEFINTEKLSLELDYLDKIKESMGKFVVIFGSARLGENNIYYRQAEEIATSLSKEGISIITGGGPGIMEAGNKGANAGIGTSVGFRIMLPFEQENNTYIEQENLFRFQFFSLRKMAFIEKADAFIVFPGGFGTLDELFEVLVNMQTLKTKIVPIYLVGKNFWQGMVEWIAKDLIDNAVIKGQDLNLFCLTDDLETISSEIVKQLKTD